MIVKVVIQGHEIDVAGRRPRLPRPHLYQHIVTDDPLFQNICGSSSTPRRPKVAADILVTTVQFDAWPQNQSQF